MPPRPRLANIQYAVQTDGVTPVLPANFDAHLTVVVSGPAYRWRSLLPFLPWADEVVAAGVSPSSATISYFELEALLLILLDFQPTASAHSPIDTGLKPDFMDRVLRMLAQADIITRPMVDEEAFFGVVFPYVQGLQSPANAFLQVVPTAIVAFTPRGAPYADDLEWLESLTWAKLKSSRGSYAEARWFLRLLGPRASRDSRQNADARLALMSKQLFAGWASIYEDFAFPPQVTAGQVAAWFTNLKWPMALNSPMPDLNKAISDFLRMYRYETTDTATKSLLIAEVFDRVLALCPQLRIFAGDSHAMDAFNAFRPMLAVYDITKQPLLEDWQTLDIALTPLHDMVADIGSGSDRLMARVQLAMEDKRKEMAVKDTSVSSDVKDTSATRRGKVSAASLNLLRRDPKLLMVVQRVKHELDRPDGTRRGEILGICLKSRLSGVVRYITGVLDTLEVADVFASLTHLRIRKLTVDSLAPLCEHLWTAVFSQEIMQNDLVGNASFHPSFIKDIFSMKWDSIDWEQRLVHDLDLARAGEQYDGSKSRPKAQWFMSEAGLIDLMGPMQLFMSELGFDDANQENSCAAILGSTLKGYQDARRQPATAKSVFNRSREAWFQALREANQGYLDFYEDSSAVAPFPTHWLGTETKCLARVASTMAAAKTYLRWKADLSEVMEVDSASGDKRGAPDAEESEKLKKQIKTLKEDLKTAKAVQGPSSLCDLHA